MVRYYIEHGAVFDRYRGDQPLLRLELEGKGRAPVATPAEQTAIVAALNALDDRTRQRLATALASK